MHPDSSPTIAGVSTTPILSPSTAATRTWTAVLFDLDGTILDSARSITGALEVTFTELGLPVPVQDELMAYVGPPLLDSLKSLAGLNDADAWNALALYRSHYEKDATRTAVFPGVAGLLERLQRAGMPVALATSKPERVARTLLEHFGLTKYFTAIAGASDDESRSAKSDIVADAIEHLRNAGVDTERAVMVGDRGYDVVGAAANDIPTILVEWGYGSPVEAVEAISTAHSVDQLCKKLLG